jgi:spore coat protein E
MLKEIVTKAVISKGKIVESKEIELDVNEQVNKTIGCWIINHNYLSVVEGNKVYAKGYYDVHVWCAINDSTDTILLKKTIEYKEEIIMDNINFDKENADFRIYCIDYPTCNGLQLVENKVLINVKKGLAVDAIGESKLVVQVSDNYNNDENLGINVNYINR